MSRTVSLGLVALCAAATATLARAEETGTGIAVGDGSLHLMLDLDGRWDSFATLNAAGDPEPDFLFDIRPGLKLSIPSSTFSFDLGGDVDELLYIFATELDRTLGDASLGIGINHGGSVSLDIAALFNRANNGELSTLPFAVITDAIDASAKLGIRPGGGALSIDVGYEPSLWEQFESVGTSTGAAGFTTCSTDSPLCDPSNASLMDFYKNAFSLTLGWKFLPKTSLLVGGDFGIVSYLNAGSGATANVPMDLVDGWVGLTGLLTTRLEIIAKAGYAQTLISNFSAAPGLSSVGNNQTLIGQLELTWLFTDTGSLKIGVLRALNPVPSNLADGTDNKPYLNFHWLIAGRLTLRLDLSFDDYNYVLNTAGSPAGRIDEFIRLDVGPDFEIARWLRVGAGYAFTNMASTDAADFAYHSLPALAIGMPNPVGGYSDNEVYLRVLLQY